MLLLIIADTGVANAWTKINLVDHQNNPVRLQSSKATSSIARSHKTVRNIYFCSSAVPRENHATLTTALLDDPRLLYLLIRISTINYGNIRVWLSRTADLYNMYHRDNHKTCKSLPSTRDGYGNTIRHLVWDGTSRSFLLFLLNINNMSRKLKITLLFLGRIQGGIQGRIQMIFNTLFGYQS